MPPATHSFSPEGLRCLNRLADISASAYLGYNVLSHFLSIAGYLPQNLYSLNSAYGSERLLKALLQKMKQYNVRAMADIVINHRIGTTRGNGGRYNRYDGIALPWDERAVTSCTGGLVMNISYTSHKFRLCAHSRLL